MSVMSVILFVLGILITGAGIVTIGFGIPINEFNLGNTMIVSGTTALAAGLILIGLAAAVDQLTQIAQALRPRVGARPAPQPQAVAQTMPAGARPGQGKARMPAPPKGPFPTRPKAEERVLEPAEHAPEVSASAIERLRSNLVRPDRKAADVDAENFPYAPGAPAPGAQAGYGPGIGANGPAPSGGAGAALDKPRLDFLFRSKARDEQPEAFDSVWPKGGPRLSEEQGNAGEPARPADEAPIDKPSGPEAPPAPAPDEMRPAAILKSGVVDGMAYTLYADGSIEAQLPQGTVRFGSIAELRSHIENNS